MGSSNEKMIIQEKKNKGIKDEAKVECSAARLPSEIWSTIIGHLKRTLPPSKIEVERSKVQQSDLATCMRVSKMFFEVTSLILYDTPIVTDLSSFFLSMVKPIVPLTYRRDVPPIRPKASTTRLSTLAHVRNLHFTLDATPTGPLYRMILQMDGMWWPIIGDRLYLNEVKPNLLFNTILQVDDILYELGCYPADYLPNLQSVSTGSFKIIGGPDFEISHLINQHRETQGHHTIGFFIAKKLDSLSLNISHWLSLIKPRFLCLDGDTGPWSGTQPMMFIKGMGKHDTTHNRDIESTKLPHTLYSHNCSINKEGLDSHLPFVQLGSTNIYAFEHMGPAEPFNPVGMSIWEMSMPSMDNPAMAAPRLAAHLSHDLKDCSDTAKRPHTDGCSDTCTQCGQVSGVA